MDAKQQNTQRLPRLTQDEKEAYRLKWLGITQADSAEKLGCSRAKIYTLLQSVELKRQAAGYTAKDIAAVVSTIKGKTQRQAGRGRKTRITQQAIQDAQARASQKNPTISKILDEFGGTHERKPKRPEKPFSARALAEAERRSLAKLAVDVEKKLPCYQKTDTDEEDDRKQEAFVAGLSALTRNPTISSKALREAMRNAARKTAYIGKGTIDYASKTFTERDKDRGLEPRDTDKGGRGADMRHTGNGGRSRTEEQIGSEPLDRKERYWRRRDIQNTIPIDSRKKQPRLRNARREDQARIIDELRHWIWQARPAVDDYGGEPRRMSDLARASSNRKYPATITCKQCRAVVPTYYVDPRRPDVCFDCWGECWRRECVRHRQMLNTKPKIGSNPKEGPT